MSLHPLRYDWLGTKPSLEGWTQSGTRHATVEYIQNGHYTGGDPIEYFYKFPPGCFISYPIDTAELQALAEVPYIYNDTLLYIEPNNVIIDSRYSKNNFVICLEFAWAERETISVEVQAKDDKGNLLWKTHTEIDKDTGEIIEVQDLDEEGNPIPIMTTEQVSQIVDWKYEYYHILRPSLDTCRVNRIGDEVLVHFGDQATTFIPWTKVVGCTLEWGMIHIYNKGDLTVYSDYMRIGLYDK